MNNGPIALKFLHRGAVSIEECVWGEYGTYGKIMSIKGNYSQIRVIKPKYSKI